MACCPGGRLIWHAPSYAQYLNQAAPFCGVGLNELLVSRVDGEPADDSSRSCANHLIRLDPSGNRCRNAGRTFIDAERGVRIGSIDDALRAYKRTFGVARGDSPVVTAQIKAHVAPAFVPAHYCEA